MNILNKNELIDKLFVELLTLYPEFKNCLKKDGIVFEENFDKQRIKVLFLAKEANNPDKTSGDFREWFKTEPKLYLFGYRIGLFAYGILNDFPEPVEQISKVIKRKALLNIAFLNIKKTGGDSTSSDNKLIEYLKMPFCKNLVINQVDIIKPDIIVSGIGNNLLKSIFSERELITLNQKTYHFKDIFIIDFYHPSARIKNQFLYSHLKEKLEYYKSYILKN